ncbi:MAG: hypothetical protein GC131_06300 [Alphaproteobacteria bacterium]|nr:hypothetical protein [Alphaproteobacteria bacterium]
MFFWILVGGGAVLVLLLILRFVFSTGVPLLPRALTTFVWAAAGGGIAWLALHISIGFSVAMLPLIYALGRQWMVERAKWREELVAQAIRQHSQGPPRAAPPPKIPEPPQTAMTRAEALAILALGPGANAEAIRAAHKNMMLRNHPDQGGSTYIASKINQAKDVLLKS